MIASFDRSANPYLNTVPLGPLGLLGVEWKSGWVESGVSKNRQLPRSFFGDNKVLFVRSRKGIPIIINDKNLPVFLLGFCIV